MAICMLVTLSTPGAAERQWKRELRDIRGDVRKVVEQARKQEQQRPNQFAAAVSKLDAALAKSLAADHLVEIPLLTRVNDACSAIAKQDPARDPLLFDAFRRSVVAALGSLPAGELTAFRAQLRNAWTSKDRVRSHAVEQARMAMLLTAVPAIFAPTPGRPDPALEILADLLEEERSWIESHRKEPIPELGTAHHVLDVLDGMIGTRKLTTDSEAVLARIDDVLTDIQGSATASNGARQHAPGRIGYRSRRLQVRVREQRRGLGEKIEAPPTLARVSEFMGIPVEGAGILILVDAAGSAGPDRSTVRDAIVDLLKSFPEGATYNLLYFGRKNSWKCSLTGKSAGRKPNDLPAETALVNRFFETMPTDDGKYLEATVALALSAPTVDTVFLVSDGLQSPTRNQKRADLLTVFRNVRARNYVRCASIHCVSLGKELEHERSHEGVLLLEQIARTCRGQHRVYWSDARRSYRKWRNGAGIHLVEEFEKLP